MNKHIIAVASAIAISISASPAMAAPITDSSLVSLLQYDTVSGINAGSSYSADSYHSYALTSEADVQGYGDLATGRVGTRATNTGSYTSQSYARVFDTLTFDAAVEISFDFAYEGALATTSPFGNPRSIGMVGIYDITGLSSWLKTSDFFGADLVSSVSEATLVTAVSGQIKDLALPTDGAFYDYSLMLSGSFMADPTKTYGIQIYSDSYAGSNAGSDFLGTGTFSFTNLNGASYTSGSGTFLSAQTGTVPEPSVIWLFSLGLIGLIGMSKKNSKNHTLLA